MPKLQKTSLQMSPTVLKNMDSWPGLTRSEALRLSVERGHYLSTLNAESISCLVTRYDSILQQALEPLNYGDYVVAVRSLPSLVGGLLSSGESGISRKDSKGNDFDLPKLIRELESLNPIERIGVLDCVVAERHRNATQKATAQKQ